MPQGGRYEIARAAQDTLAEATAFATESLSAMRVMQAFLAEAASVARFRAAALGAYEAARRDASPRHRHDGGDVPRLRQRRRRALARRAGRADAA